MAQSLDLTIALIAVTPFVAAVLAPLLFNLMGAYAGWLLAIVPAVLFVVLLQLLSAAADGGAITAGFDWIAAYGIRFSFIVDGLSLAFALTITGVGVLILIYSAAYLKGHAHQGRFFAFMLAFMGAMLGLVLADSMVTLFTFWELTTVTSFLLIGFDHSRQAARRAAIQALVITGGGGLLLLLGFILLQAMLGSWDLSALRHMGDMARGNPLYPLALLLVLGGAFTKSAQVPFHFWLPNAMEAPTPVSAFLHSATMVQGGVYLLLRLTPILGGSALWTALLTIFGGATLLWGAVMALKQTDLKQMLAQSTIASLGLLVLLIGVGTEVAITAALVYFLAHALYKAALFLAVGVIDHETGTREIIALGGLNEKLPATFIAAAIAGFSMIGLPLSAGYLAKEEMYAGLFQGDWRSIVGLLVAILGNALLAGVALAIVIRPFLGTTVSTPKVPHEGSVGLLAGPLLLAALGLAVSIATATVGSIMLAPAAAAVLGLTVESHLAMHVNPVSPLFWLSVLTWGLGALCFVYLDAVRIWLRRLDARLGWNADRLFDGAMFGLIRFAGTVTRTWHHGRLDRYLLVLFILLAAAVLAPIGLLGGLPSLPAFPRLTFYEWGIGIVALAGLVALLIAPSRLVAIVSLGIQGFAVAMIFLLFGAPDLAFTQFMVEILSVVILALVMTRLRLDTADHRELEIGLRDAVAALACGIGVTLLLWAILEKPLDMRLSTFFEQTSVAIAHGHNIVNVILVDYRGLDTLGEISVVMTAGIAILALIRSQRRPASADGLAPKAGRRRAVSKP
ncbi:MAG TPA: putative monovalent cation/H+ antiporter subunit A [Devosiaceae bacterium]